MRIITFLCIILILFPSESNSKSLTSGFIEDNKPFSYFNRYKKDRGIDVDFFKFLARELDKRPNYFKVSWENWLELLNGDTIELVCSGLLISDYLRDKVLFSRPYREVKYLLIAKPHHIYESIKELYQGHARLGVVRGSWYAELLRTMQSEPLNNFEIEYYDSLSDAQEALFLADIDAIAIRSDEIELFSDHNIYSVGQFTAPDYFGIAVKKDNTDLLQEIDNLLENLREMKNWEEIQEKYSLKDDDKLKFGRTYYTNVHNTLTYDICEIGWAAPNDMGVALINERALLKIKLKEMPSESYIFVRLHFYLDQAKSQSLQDPIRRDEIDMIFNENEELLYRYRLIDSELSDKNYFACVFPVQVHDDMSVLIDINVPFKANVNNIYLKSITVYDGKTK